MRPRPRVQALAGSVLLCRMRGLFPEICLAYGRFVVANHPTTERKPMQRVLIKCGWLVTLDPGIGDFKGGELLFRGNRIEAVGRRLDAAADEVIDATDKIV